MDHKTLEPEEILLFMNFCNGLRHRQFARFTRFFTRIFCKRWRRNSIKDIANRFCKFHRLFCCWDSQSEYAACQGRRRSEEVQSRGQWSKAFSKPRYTRLITGGQRPATRIVVGSKPHELQLSRNSTLITRKDWGKFSRIGVVQIKEYDVNHISEIFDSPAATKSQKRRRRGSRPRNRKRKPRKGNFRGRSNSKHNSPESNTPALNTVNAVNVSTEEFISGLDIDTMSSVSPAERLNVRALLHAFLEDQIINASMDFSKF